jgi:TPR repeat protein
MRNTLIALSVFALSCLASFPVRADTPPDFNALKTAAEQGDPQAQSALGDAYADDQNGHQPDMAEAKKWYQMAAAQGEADAAYALGGMYDSGAGVAQDYAQAANWYRQAAAGGHAGAEYVLGSYSEHGTAMQQDDAGAARWYQQAACQGDASAAQALSDFYAQGRALPKDPMAADFWARAAQRQMSQESPNAQPDADSAEALRRIESQLSPDQTGAVQKALGAWEPAEAPPYVADAALDSLDAQQLQARASQGDLAAQYALGNLFDCGGRGVHRDYSQALSWFRQAANSGFTPAQVSLGWYFEHGRTVEEDDTIAQRWYQTAAAHGSEAGRLAYARLNAPHVDPPGSRAEAPGGAPGAPAAAAGRGENDDDVVTDDAERQEEERQQSAPAPGHASNAGPIDWNAPTSRDR